MHGKNDAWQKRYWLKVLIGMAFIHGLLYAFLIPPWQAPDEDAHYFASYMYAYTGRLPLRADVPAELLPAVADEILSHNYMFLRGRSFNARGDNYSSLFRTVERYSPSYALYGIATKLVLNQTFIVQFYVMRLVSVIIYVGVVAVAFLSVYLLRPQALELAIGTSIFLIFWPQHAFITTSINDGNLAELFTTLVFYFVILILMQGLTSKRLILALMCFVLAFISKSTTYFLAPLLGILIADRLARSAFSQNSTISHWIRLFGFSILVVALGLLLFFRAGLLQFAIQSPNELGLLFERWVTGSLASVFWGLYKSSWLVLGWMNIALDDVFYQFLLIIMTVLLVGWWLNGRSLFQGVCQISALRFLELAGAIVTLMLLLVIILFPNGPDYQQGRFLFAASLPIALIITGGWLGLFKEADRILGLKSWVVVWLLIDAFVLFNFVITRFYQFPV